MRKPKPNKRLTGGGVVFTALVVVLLISAIALTTWVQVSRLVNATPTPMATLAPNNAPAERHSLGVLSVEEGKGQVVSCPITKPLNTPALLQWIRLDRVPTSDVVIAEQKGEWRFVVTRTGFVQLELGSQAVVCTTHVALMAERIHSWTQLGFSIQPDSDPRIAVGGQFVPVRVTKKQGGVVVLGRSTGPITSHGGFSTADRILFDAPITDRRVAGLYSPRGPIDLNDDAGVVGRWLVDPAERPMILDSVSTNHCIVSNANPAAFDEKIRSSRWMSRPSGLSQK